MVIFYLIFCFIFLSTVSFNLLFQHSLSDNADFPHLYDCALISTPCRDMYCKHIFLNGILLSYLCIVISRNFILCGKTLKHQI